MNITQVTERNEDIINPLVDLWEKSVKDSHTFLTENGIAEIKSYVPQAIAGVESLVVATDDCGVPLGFMGAENGVLEMLFITPEHTGKGIGKKLLTYAIENFGVTQLTVNEQNPKATAFYEHMGFKTYKRTETDERGMSYPLLYMEL
ncbi:MAG: GNAT family N-acetyltransferase [Oscillospiraceae bacterium]|nr:GNAT family N-acetyltransferase [Oscillospiraceae bacterium]